MRSRIFGINHGESRASAYQLVLTPGGYAEKFSGQRKSGNFTNYTVPVSFAWCIFYLVYGDGDNPQSLKYSSSSKSYASHFPASLTCHRNAAYFR